MKKKRIIPILTAATLLCLAATLLLTTACSQENTPAPTPPTGEPVEVQFQIPGFVEMSDGGTTRATSALPEGTTVRVNVYPTTTMSKVKPLAHQAYSMKGGHLVPCTVNADGSFKADDPTGKISLPPGKYFFFTYTPALEFKFDDPHYLIDIPQNTNFATSGTPNTVVAFTGGVNLNPLNRACSRLQLKVKCDDASTAMTAMTVNSVTLSGINADHKEYLFGGSVPQTSSGTASVTTTTFTKDATNPLISTGDIILFATGRSTTIPVQVSFDVTYTALGIEFNETFSGDLDLTLEFGKSYTLNATISKDGGIHLGISAWEESNQNTDMGVGTYPYVIKFPYNTDSYVISQDLNGSSGAAFHPIWTGSIPHLQNCGFSSAVSPHFLVSSKYISTPNWDQAMLECTNRGVGWRLPTMAEGLLIEQLKRSGKLTLDNGAYDYFWSATYTTPDKAILIHSIYANGFIEMAKNVATAVRCIKDYYPYLARNAKGKVRVIVNKDKGGASSLPLHNYWSVTPIHTVGDATDTHAAILEVAESDAPNPTNPATTLMTWHVATSTTTPACKAPWRIPTRSESGDINSNKASLEMDEITATGGTFYWTASKDSGGNIYCFGATVSNSPDSTGKVRCVRDL